MLCQLSSTNLRECQERDRLLVTCVAGLLSPLSLISVVAEVSSDWILKVWPHWDLRLIQGLNQVQTIGEDITNCISDRGALVSLQYIG